MTDASDKELGPARVVRLATEAEGYLEFGLFHRALDRAEQLLAGPAGRQAGLSLKAEIFRRQERYQEALPVLKVASQEFPQDEGVWVNLGWCRKRTGRLDLAIQAMDRLLEHFPESPLGHFNLACYLALAGEKERSLGQLEISLALDPSFRRLAREEADLDLLRGDPEFQALLEED